MSRSRKGRKQRPPAPDSDEAARTLETLLGKSRQGDAQAREELTRRLVHCLDRERLRPLHQVLGSLTEQRSWRAFEALRSQIEELAGERPAQVIDEEGQPAPARAVLFVSPVVIREPALWPERGEALAPPRETLEALARTFRAFGAVSPEDSVELAPLLVPPEGLYGLEWTRARGLIQELSLGERAPGELLCRVAATRAIPERGVRLMIGVLRGSPRTTEDFFEACEKEMDGAKAEETWNDTFGEHLSAWLGGADRDGQAVVVLPAQRFYAALGERLSQAQDLAALEEAARGLASRQEAERATLEALAAEDGCALILQAYAEGAEQPSSEVTRGLWPHERAGERIAAIRSWLEDAPSAGGGDEDGGPAADTGAAAAAGAPERHGECSAKGAGWRRLQRWLLGNGR
ncbi:hypothetical protein [Halorhodospira halophila]|uniref:hypothetical protein n=1 Tax=Halorhodospira halophila TaxID=1053 RepID=UPI0019122CF0|nr:hypothetical protein [Halorhodospira halophila]MBK5935490.1 hypothetical protein [Halorhodospira halophila]